MSPRQELEQLRAETEKRQSRLKVLEKTGFYKWSESAGKNANLGDAWLAALEAANAELKRKGDTLARWAGAVVSDFTWELNSAQQLSMIAKQERIEKLDAALREWGRTKDE